MNVITCPDCGKEIIVEFDTARCLNCGWFAADAELEEILDENADTPLKEK